MIKRTFYGLMVCGMAVGLVGLGLLASPLLDTLLGHYPGSVRTANEEVSFHLLDQQAIQRQATYQTPDKLAVVQRWYAARLRISPASDQYTTGGDGCAFLSDAHVVGRFQHTVTVLVCSLPAGTRVVVNERLALR